MTHYCQGLSSSYPAASESLGLNYCTIGSLPPTTLMHDQRINTKHITEATQHKKAVFSLCRVPAFSMRHYVVRTEGCKHDYIENLIKGYVKFISLLVLLQFSPVHLSWLVYKIDW